MEKVNEKEKMIYTFQNMNKEDVKVFLPKMEIDMETMKQIKHMSDNTVLKNIRIMPDCHRGHGCCVGLTAKIDDKVFPRYVGVDIGCGISMYPLNIKLKPKKIPKLEQAIRKLIPMGAGVSGKNKSCMVRDEDWKWLQEKCDIDLENLKENTREKFPLYHHPETLDKQYFVDMMERIGCKFDTDIKSVGTLGGGNHYVEINEQSNIDDINYITVHSGSRNIGYKICHYHQAKIDDNSDFDRVEYAQRAKHIDRTFKVSKIIKELKSDVRDELMANRHPNYLEGDEMMNYLVDMIVGQNLACLNRLIMIRNFVEFAIGEFDPKNIIETRHNYIDFDRFLLRKGSISAEDGETCIISLNMRDGVLLCKGKGNADWNYSSAHGCGRLMSRLQASRLSLKEFKKEMQDVYSTCVRKETLDESPMAYRDAELVKKCIGESVEILQQLKPVINCKGF